MSDLKRISLISIRARLLDASLEERETSIVIAIEVNDQYLLPQCFSGNIGGKVDIRQL